MRIALAEQVWIDLEPASFGSRSLAYILDFIARWSVFSILFLIILFGSGQFFDLSEAFFSGFDFLRAYLGTYIWALIGLFFFFIEWSYPIYFEVFKDGVTPGKKAFGLRVINEDGLPLTFRESLLRTLLLTVDLQGMGLVALLSMFFSKKSQRLGDLLAKTMVVYEDKLGSRVRSTNQQEEHFAKHTLPLNLYNIIEQFIERSKNFEIEAKTKAINSILKAIQVKQTVLDIPSSGNLAEKEAWLKSFFREAQPEKTSEAKSKKDVVIDWKRLDQELLVLEGDLNKLVASAKKTQSKQVLFSFAESYQRLCQHFSYLATFYPNTYQAKKTSSLVRTGRRLIYGKRLSSLRSAKEPFFSRVPEIFSKLQTYTLCSLILGISGGVLAAVLVQLNPNIAWYFLSEEAVANLKMGRLWTEEIQGISAIASSRIMTNNITVSFSAFALGITGGIGTVLIIVFNGVSLGGIFSALSFYDMAYRLFNFVVAHGFLELSVIIVAGACGLYIGDALIHPGTLSRKRALQKHAVLVVDLIIFNALCLVVAGLVEGYISPYEFIPFWFKLALGTVLCYAYWAYLLWGSLLPPGSRRLRLGRYMQTFQ